MKAVRGQRYLYRRGDQLYFRRGVPQDALNAFDGRKEIQVSLGTSNVAEARHRLQREVDKFETKLAAVRQEVAPVQIATAPYQPTSREIEAAVRKEFAARLERVEVVNRSNSAEVFAARRRLEDLKVFRANTVASRKVASDGPTLDTIWMSEVLCERNGWLIDETSNLWWELVNFVARSQIEAAERQLQDLEGDIPNPTDTAFAPEQFARDEIAREKGEIRSGAAISLLSLFAAYVQERKPQRATIKSFGAKVRAFVHFLEHDDARRITKQDVVRWKAFLLEKGSKHGEALSARSVRETFLPAIRIALQRGVERGDLPTNVAAGIRVLGPKTTKRLRSASFTDDEADLILRASLEEQGPKLSPESRFARRWVPWLCAYTGARVNEITQMRAEDVYEVDGVTVLLITPEAGGTKNGSARLVALHPHLLKQGFPDALRGKSGPIFFNPSRRRGGSDENQQAKKVGEHLARWVRQIGIIDRSVQPNHAWRHRFKTLARECRMSEEIRDYIQGHVPRTEGERYGEIKPKVIFREISLLKSYAID